MFVLPSYELAQGTQDEIQPDELMEEFDNADQPQEEHIHLGFVKLHEQAADPVFSLFQKDFFLSQSKVNADAVRLWANHFSSGPAQSSVLIPQIWSDFFTALLSNPSSFDWARNFLTSQAWKFMSDKGSGVPFSIPEKFPSIQVPTCSKVIPDPNISDSQFETLLIDNSDTPSPASKDKGKSVMHDSPSTPVDKIKNKISPSSGPWSKAFLDQAEQLKLGSFLEDPQKRRSKRMQQLRNGYNEPQCSSKNCLGCNVEPPNLSPSVIRNLGVSLCKIDEKELTEPALNKKKKVTVPAPGGRKAAKKKSAPDGKNTDDAKKDQKKPKK